MINTVVERITPSDAGYGRLDGWLKKVDEACVKYGLTYADFDVTTYPDYDRDSACIEYFRPMTAEELAKQAAWKKELAEREREQYFRLKKFEGDR